MLKALKERVKNFIALHYVIVLAVAFGVACVSLAMLYQTLYNVFAWASALFSMVTNVRLLTWRFGVNGMWHDRSMSRKHAEFKKSDNYRPMCLDDAAEAFILSAIALPLAVIFVVCFYVFA